MRPLCTEEDSLLGFCSVWFFFGEELELSGQGDDKKSFFLKRVFFVIAKKEPQEKGGRGNFFMCEVGRQNSLFLTCRRGKGAVVKIFPIAGNLSYLRCKDLGPRGRHRTRN